MRTQTRSQEVPSPTTNPTACEGTPTPAAGDASTALDPEEQEKDDLTAAWIGQVRWAAAQAVTATITVGQTLVRGKCSTPYRHFSRLLLDESMPFSQRRAEQLIAVASHRWLADQRHHFLLPGSTETLYLLSGISPQELASGVRSKVIHPRMTIGDARKFVDSCLEQQNRRCVEAGSSILGETEVGPAKSETVPSGGGTASAVK